MSKEKKSVNKSYRTLEVGVQQRLSAQLCCIDVATHSEEVGQVLRLAESEAGLGLVKSKIPEST